VKKMGETDDKWIQNWTLYYWEREGSLYVFRSKTIYITDIIETRYKLMERRRNKNERE
jgi:hypothetical protein